MNESPFFPGQGSWPILAEIPTPLKALFTAIILFMAIAMLGALGQIIIHDIVPTFFGEVEKPEHAIKEAKHAIDTSSKRGDLLDLEPEEEKPRSESFYKTEQFAWTLKWTHIHFFGMSMIFIFMGIIALFLNMGARKRVWLIVLPFVGVQIDIAAIWLKGYVSSAFFWLHIPGGGLFASIFFFVSCRALYEMWISIRKDK